MKKSVMDYEELILARQEDETSYDECSECKFVHICRADAELGLDGECYARKGDKC